jgi:hypothetical protein
MDTITGPSPSPLCESLPSCRHLPPCICLCPSPFPWFLSVCEGCVPPGQTHAITTIDLKAARSFPHSLIMDICQPCYHPSSWIHILRSMLLVSKQSKAIDIARIEGDRFSPAVRCCLFGIPGSGTMEHYQARIIFYCFLSLALIYSTGRGGGPRKFPPSRSANSAADGQTDQFLRPQTPQQEGL